MGDIGQFTQDIRGFLGGSLDRFAQNKQLAQAEYSPPVRLGGYIQGQLADPLDRLAQVRGGLPGGGSWGQGAQGTIPTLDWLSGHGTPFRNPYSVPPNPLADPQGFARWLNPSTPASTSTPGSYPQPGPAPSSAPTSGGPSTGLEPGVAAWAAQTRQTFGGIIDPDTMLAIMTNESHGDPNVQNHQGYPAYGLFQLWDQPGLTVDQQFQAAKQLAQQKLASIDAAYSAHGMNPDARTRARDFALAWGGHFDYDTGLPDPNSRDKSGQTAQQLGDVFLSNYDKIKAGRQQPQPAPGGSTLPQVPGGTGMLAGPWAFPVVGWSGQVQNHWGTDETGASDIMAAAGTPIVAMHGGKVIDASYDQYGGNTVTIQDEQGRQYYYAHMQQPTGVQVGQTLQAGAALGNVGNTGDAAGGPTHLHLGITAPNTNIKLGNGSQGGAGWAWGSGPQDNAVGLLGWVLNGGR